MLSHPLASTGMKLCLLFTVEDKNASLSGRNKRKATMKECQVSRCGICMGSSNVYKHPILHSLNSYTPISVQRACKNVFSLAVS